MHTYTPASDSYTYTTVFYVWFTHTLYYSVGFVHTHTHIYIALLPHTHTYIYIILFCVWFKCIHAPIYTQIYTMLFDSYTQLHMQHSVLHHLHKYTYTRTLHYYLIYMHILTYWYIYIHTKMCNSRSCSYSKYVFSKREIQMWKILVWLFRSYYKLYYVAIYPDSHLPLSVL